MTVKKIGSNSKTQVLGNRNRKNSQEEFFMAKSVSSDELDSFDVRSRMNWLEKVRAWFM